MTLDTNVESPPSRDEDVDTKDYLRVTQVLYPFSGLQHIDKNVVANAALRGTKVHTICEGIITGLGEFSTEEETRPYVESFKKWWGDGHPVVEIEKRFYCEEIKVTGRVDLIIDTPSGLAIVDLKTSYKPSKTWFAQGSAYCYLARKAGYDIKRIIFLHLNREGKEPRLFEYECDPSFFLSVLKVFRHFYYPIR